MWYNKIVNNLGQIPSAILYYNSELDIATDETQISGVLEKNAKDLSGITSYRFIQLQEIEAILKFLNIQYDKLRSIHYKRYLERYDKILSDRSIEKYIDGEDDVINMAILINEVGLVRNKYLAIMKGLDVKQYQLSNIVKLRCVGLESVILENNHRG